MARPSEVASRVGRLGWGVADQALSSATNFALGLMVARSLSASAFGAFGIVFSTYMIALAVSRAVCSEPLLVRFHTVEVDRWKAAVSSSLGATLLLGSACGTVTVAIGIFLPATHAEPFLLLGLLLPGLALQDGWRYAFFAGGLARSAFLNDLAWALLLLAGFAYLVHAGGASLLAFVTVWGVAGAAASFVGVAQSHIWPQPTAALAWLRTHRDLYPRYIGEFVALIGGQYLVLYGLGLTSSLAQAGAFRGGQLVFGPVVVLLVGAGTVAVPEAARALQRSVQSFEALCRGLSLCLALAAAVWTFIVVAMPDRVGREILGQSWSGAETVLVPLGLSMVAAGLATGAIVGLRSLAAASLALRTRLLASGLAVAGGISGGVLYGAVGAAVGWAICLSASVPLWWFTLARALHQAADPPGSPRGTGAPMVP